MVCFWSLATYQSVSGICLPQLPTKFYDGQLLTRVGGTIASLLKVDSCTSSTLGGRYAQLCVELPLEEPVLTSIKIGSHGQQIIYEGEGFLCTSCGHIGHTKLKCTYKVTTYATKSTPSNGVRSQSTSTKTRPNEEWQMFVFPRKHMASHSNSPHQMEAPQMNHRPSINVKIYSATAGKFVSSTYCISTSSKENVPSSSHHPLSSMHINSPKKRTKPTPNTAKTCYTNHFNPLAHMEQNGMDPLPNDLIQSPKISHCKGSCGP